MDLPRCRVVSLLSRDHPCGRGTAQHLDLAAGPGLVGNYRQPVDVSLHQFIRRRQQSCVFGQAKLNMLMQPPFLPHRAYAA